MSRSRHSAHRMAEISRAFFSVGATRVGGGACATIVMGGSCRTNDSFVSDRSITVGGDAARELGALAASDGRSTNGRLSSYVRAAADPAAASHTPTVMAMMRFLGIAMTLLLPKRECSFTATDKAPRGCLTDGENLRLVAAKSTPVRTICRHWNPPPRDANAK